MRRNVLSWISLWAPVLFWAGLIFYFSMIPDLRFVEGGWDFWIRKLGHLMTFAILARLLARALAGSTAWSWKQIFYASLVLTFLYACSDEYHQGFTIGRVASPRDVVIDTLGAWAALGFKP